MEKPDETLSQLRALLNRYTQPCAEDCEHSQCPLLRELHALHINRTLKQAQATVKPIVDQERTGEFVGDLMNMRLDAAAASSPLPAEPAQPQKCSECGAENGWHRTACSRHPRFAAAQPDGEQEPSLEDLAVQAADFLCGVASTQAQQLAFALKARVASSRAATPPDTPVVAKAIAKDVVSEILNVPRFVRNPESTIIEIENKVAAIITRYLGATPTQYIHLPQFPMNGTELECDGEELRPDGTCARCERINDRIEAKIATTSPSETAVGGELVNDVVQVPPPAHVKFTKAGRAYADINEVIDTELTRNSASVSAVGDEKCMCGRDSDPTGRLPRLDILCPKHDAAPVGAAGDDEGERPRIICLCGSTRFIEQFAITTWELEREGYIVLGCTLLPMWYCNTPSHFGEATGTKEQCDELHKRKIDLADEVLVLNIGGYIGESTASEIEYATRLGKPVRYVESDAAALRSGKGEGK